MKVLFFISVLGLGIGIGMLTVMLIPSIVFGTNIIPATVTITDMAMANSTSDSTNTNSSTIDNVTGFNWGTEGKEQVIYDTEAGMNLNLTIADQKLVNSSVAPVMEEAVLAREGIDGLNYMLVENEDKSLNLYEYVDANDDMTNIAGFDNMESGLSANNGLKAIMMKIMAIDVKDNQEEVSTTEETSSEGSPDTGDGGTDGGENTMPIFNPDDPIPIGFPPSGPGLEPWDEDNNRPITTPVVDDDVIEEEDRDDNNPDSGSQPVEEEDDSSSDSDSGDSGDSGEGDHE